ncbi:hypothetical protein [Chitinophaga sancti]|uniref:DUF6268 domain-containing protein n=1 Tax=Chitinophaga sancti TaxID=1004 RepID=A0A1K1S4L5_9BACT|nr:hypothetical protein [Chitinophaga sancti]WQD63706.1 hypothetical protein U0033_04805 [Chitinophaga sancti]WQG90669.1 hypothetical protein SR876_04115 [Chitinophaga sancti]SFW79262.1 hypothetical protein SAMN05661012_04757 [Chitinophaga sancti]
MRYVFIAFALLSGTGLSAQGINYTYDGGNYSAQTIMANARFPLLKNMLGNVTYRHLTLEDHTLQSGAMQLYYNIKFSERKSLVLIGTGGLYNEGWRYGAGFRYQYKHTSKVKAGIGMMYNKQFFGNQLIPFLEVNYEPSEKWTITGLFPIKPKVMYHFNTSVSVGLEISGEASSYRMAETFLRNNQWTGLCRFEWLFTKHLLFNAGIGRNFINRYQFFDNHVRSGWTIITIPLGEKASPLYEKESKGMSATIGLAVRMNRD